MDSAAFLKNTREPLIKFLRLRWVVFYVAFIEGNSDGSAGDVGDGAWF